MQGVARLRVQVLSGPNLDRLGTREPEIYGTTTLDEIHARLVREGELLGVDVVCRQSSHEGELAVWLNRAKEDGFAGGLLNAGGLTHTSVVLLDAIKAGQVPVVEVHLSNPDSRESFRRRSVIAPACLGRVAGFGAASYSLGLVGLLGALRRT